MEIYEVEDVIFSKEYNPNGKTVILVLDKPYPYPTGCNVVVINGKKYQFVLPNLKIMKWIEIESDEDFRGQTLYFERIENLDECFPYSHFENVGYW